MTLRHRPRSARGTLSRLAIGAAASLAVVASTGVTAGAADDATTDESGTTSQAPTETPEDTTGDAVEGETPSAPEESTEEGLTEGPSEDAATVTPGAPAPQSAEVAGETAAADELPVVPDFGSQKVRVGVQLADGAYVPEGTSLAGSVLQITITGGVDGDGAELPDESFPCTTTGNSFGQGSGQSSTCDGGNFDGSFDLDAGRTMTVQHLSSPPGVAVNPEPIVIGTCDLNEVVSCSGTRDALVTVTGTLPAANPDAVSTSFGTPILIDVLANDDSGNGAPLTGLSIAEQPTHGTAEVVGEVPASEEPEPEPSADTEVATTQQAQVAAAPTVAAAPSPVQVLYTPNAGFAGTDTFVYAVSTPNGTVTGVVTVQVLAAAPTTPGAVTPGAVTPVRTGVLPSVGGSDATLVGLGALLVTAGVATVAAGRRREEVRGLLG